MSADLETRLERAMRPRPLSAKQVEYLRAISEKLCGVSYDGSSTQRSLLGRGLLEFVDAFNGVYIITDAGRAALASSKKVATSTEHVSRTTRPLVGGPARVLG